MKLAGMPGPSTPEEMDAEIVAEGASPLPAAALERPVLQEMRLRIRRDCLGTSIPPQQRQREGNHSASWGVANCVESISESETEALHGLLIRLCLNRGLQVHMGLVMYGWPVIQALHGSASIIQSFCQVIWGALPIQP